MPEPDKGQPLPEKLRRVIFAALVEAQDQLVPVARSREVVAHRFGVTAVQLRDIEREGLDHTWPPL
jgi:hypothetical protein